MNTPIIRIELESMKTAMSHAFSEQMLQMDVMFKQAVEDACEPYRVKAMLAKEAKRCLDDAVRSEVEEYFKYGEGRELVKERVIKQLDSFKD